MISFNNPLVPTYSFMAAFVETTTHTYSATLRLFAHNLNAVASLLTKFSVIAINISIKSV